MIKLKYLSKEKIHKLWKLILIPIYVLVVFHFLKDITQDILQVPTILDFLGDINEDLSHVPEKLLWFYHWAMVNTFFIELFLIIAIPKCWKNKKTSKFDLAVLASLFYLLTMFSLATFLDPKYQWVLLGAGIQKDTQRIKRDGTNKEGSILSYNVMGGVYANKITDELSKKNIKPDIVCFQEFPEDENLSSQFEKYFGSYYSSEKGPVGIHFPKRKIATFYNKEKFKLLDTRVVHLPNPNWTFWEKMFVFSVKDRVPLPFDRVALLTIFKYNGKSVIVVNTHLGWEGGLNNQIRQINFILKSLDQSGIKNNIILCGDFNVNNRSRTSRLFFEKLEQAGFSDLTDDVPYSVNLSSPFSILEQKTRPLQSTLKIVVKTLGNFGINTKQKIDYIFAKDLKKSFSEVYEIEGSDHYPILVDLVL